MLEHLHIENLAVIESADVSLSGGFSVLTGETGAGKSVLIHSLNLLLGERVGKDLIRSGCNKALVSGLFTDLSGETVRLLEEQGFDCDGSLVVQRELSVDGKTTVRINGRPATVTMLRSFSDRLVNIHGQHDNRALLDPSTHVRYLDEYAGNSEILSEYRDVFSQLRAVLNEIRDADTDEQTRMQRIDLLTYQIREIDAAELLPDEEETLSARRPVLLHGEKIESALSQAYEQCSGEGGVRELLSDISSRLDSISSLSPCFAELAQRFTALSEDLDDAACDLRDRSQEHSFDPGELDELEQRLDLIYRLKRKYGASIPEILEYRDSAQRELDALSNVAERLEELNERKEALAVSLRSVSERLTESRKAAAKTLEKTLSEQLAFLEMPNTGLCVRIEPSERFTPTGADEVEFLLSANLGEALRPLSKIASGGELSRIMLCMKTVLTSDSDGGTLIFDEVDTGVSGKAAEKIAIKLKEISRDRQVVVVTHLAQIAAYADSHFLIAKAVSDQRTFTSVTPLDESGREGEIARIMGGMNPTDATLAAARDLLATGQTRK